jgi:glycine/D-amino acid oxidase-like deaminating enzyme
VSRAADRCHEKAIAFSRISGSGIDGEKRELHSDDGVISYQTLVAATHVPIEGERGTFGAALFQTKLAAYSTYAIEAKIDSVAESLFWDTNDPYLYFRFDRRGNACSVIIGGEDHKTGQEEETEARYERLENILKKNFPSAKPKHRWSGQVIETPDGLPYMAKSPTTKFWRPVFLATG